MTDDTREDNIEETTASADTVTPGDGDRAEGPTTAYQTAAGESPQYGVGPFSIREVSLAGVWLIAFVVSFFPIYGQIGAGLTVWGSGIDWVLTIGVPTVAVFLIVLRRLSPQGIRRVGSLGIDQFASVAFSVASVLWLAIVWNSFVSLWGQRAFAGTWVVWVELVLMLAGVFLTVFAPFIAPFNEDFAGRPDAPAHRAARSPRPVTPRPVTPRPAAPAAPVAAAPVYGDYAAPAADAESTATTPYAFADAAPTEEAGVDAAGAETSSVTADAADADAQPVVEAEPAAEAEAEPATEAEPAAEEEPLAEAFGALAPAAEAEPVADAQPQAEPAASLQHQAFWALVPEERDIVDEIGIPVFRIGPTAWALVIEDRGDVFVVRHEDGRIGYLHDVSGVTRG